MTIEKIFHNEEEVYNFFAESTLDLSKLNEYSFKIEEWQDFIIKDPHKNMIISYSVMQSFSALQEEIYRTYALSKYGSASHKLSEDDKNSLQLNIGIKSGCTEFSINPTQIIELLTKNMNGTETVILALGAVLIYFGYRSWKDYLDNKSKTSLQTKAWDVMEKANKHLAEVVARSNEVKKDIIKPLSANSSISVAGIEVTSDQIKDLVRSERSSFSETRLDGFYFIDKVESKEEGFRCSLRDEESSFTALLATSMFNSEKLPIIQKGFWEKTKIFCVINAKESEGRVKEAEILDVALEEIKYNKPPLVVFEAKEE